MMNEAIGKSVMRIKTRSINILIIGYVGIWATTNLPAQNKCATAVADAQNMYDLGHTADAILLLNRCLPDSIPQVEKVQGYKILAQSYIAEDYLAEAKDAVEKLLDLNDQFEPDYSNDDKKFIEFIEASKERRKGEETKRKWLLIGGSSLVAGVATFVILSNTGGSTAERLPDPPAFPN